MADVLNNGIIIIIIMEKKLRRFKCQELTVQGAVKGKTNPVKDFRNKDFHFVLLKNSVRKIRLRLPLAVPVVSEEIQRWREEKNTHFGFHAR